MAKKKKDSSGSSPRTLLIEEAIDGITNAIVSYPSTPFTGNNADTLGRMLEALERSKRLDREDQTVAEVPEPIIIDDSGEIYADEELEEAGRMYEWARDNGFSARNAMARAFTKIRRVR